MTDSGRGAYTLGADRMYQYGLETGLRGRFQTGPVQHALTVAYSKNDRDWFRRRITNAYPERISNVYAPSAWAAPDMSLMPGTDDAGRMQTQVLSSVVLADTVSISDERLLLIVAARRQDIDQTNFNSLTGIRTSGHKDDTVTPMVGVVVRPRQHVSLFGNYSQGLQPGSIVGDTYANAGEVIPPYKTEQYEAGVKFDFGSFATTVSTYQITQPSSIWDSATNVLNVGGEQRNRGLELNTFGAVTERLRVLSGVAYTDATLTRTQDGLNDGRTVQGVPTWRIVLGAEWDAPFVPRLTITGRVLRNAAVYLDTANVRELPAWTRLDLGARYRVNGTLTMRASLDNALDNAYWVSTTRLSDPRTFSLSATFAF